MRSWVRASDCSLSSLSSCNQHSFVPTEYRAIARPHRAVRRAAGTPGHATVPTITSASQCPAFPPLLVAVPTRIDPSRASFCRARQNAAARTTTVPSLALHFVNRRPKHGTSAFPRYRIFGRRVRCAILEPSPGTRRANKSWVSSSAAVTINDGISPFLNTGAFVDSYPCPSRQSFTVRLGVHPKVSLRSDTMRESSTPPQRTVGRLVSRMDPC